MIQVLYSRFISPSVILPKPEEPEQGKQNNILQQEKKPWAPWLQREKFFQFYFKKLEKWMPVSMASSQTYSPRLAELARFVAGCLPLSLEIYYLHALSTHRTAFLLCSFVRFEIFWGKLICFLPGCPNYCKNQLMFLLMLSSQSCTGFGWSAPGSFSH